MNNTIPDNQQLTHELDKARLRISYLEKLCANDILSHAVEQSPCSIVITNTKGIIEYVNPKFTQITGYDIDEVLGQNPRILKSGEKNPEDYSQLWQTISSGKDWRGEFHNRKKNGELYWEFASISPITDASGTITHFIAIKEDITHRKELEEKLREADRHRVLAETAHAAAHEIYQPLTVIIGLSQLITTTLSDNPSLCSDLELILQSACKIKQIVQNMNSANHYATRPYANGENIIDFQKAV